LLKVECVIATLSIYIAYKGRVPGAKERDASETRVNYWACAIVKPKFGWEAFVSKTTAKCKNNVLHYCRRLMISLLRQLQCIVWH